MTDGLRKSHLRKTLQVGLSEVGLPEGNLYWKKFCSQSRILAIFSLFWLSFLSVLVTQPSILVASRCIYTYESLLCYSLWSHSSIVGARILPPNMSREKLCELKRYEISNWNSFSVRQNVTVLAYLTWIEHSSGAPRRSYLILGPIFALGHALLLFCTPIVN